MSGLKDYGKAHSYSPDMQVVIEKVYVSPGTTCAFCDKNIASRLPALAVGRQRDDEASIWQYVHDRCLGRYLLDYVVENEGDVLSGQRHSTILNGAHS